MVKQGCLIRKFYLFGFYYDTLNAMLLEAQLEEGLTKAQALARLRENNFGY